MLADEFRAESASIVHHNGQQLKCVSCLYVLGGPTIYRIGRIGPLRMGVCIKTTGLTGACRSINSGLQRHVAKITVLGHDDVVQQVNKNRQRLRYMAQLRLFRVIPGLLSD